MINIIDNKVLINLDWSAQTIVLRKRSHCNYVLKQYVLFSKNTSTLNSLMQIKIPEIMNIKYYWSDSWRFLE